MVRSPALTIPRIGVRTMASVKATKLCRGCNSELPLKCFGLRKPSNRPAARCFKCYAAQMRQWIANNREHRNALKRAKRAEYRKLNPPPVRKPGNPKVSAKGAVRNAVKTGLLLPVKECKCHHCGRPSKEYHHHLGYEREHWLSVIPLCFSCHRRAHAKHTIIIRPIAGLAWF